MTLTNCEWHYERQCYIKYCERQNFQRQHFHKPVGLLVKCIANNNEYVLSIFNSYKLTSSLLLDIFPFQQENVHKLGLLKFIAWPFFPSKRESKLPFCSFLSYCALERINFLIQFLFLLVWRQVTVIFSRVVRLRSKNKKEWTVITITFHPNKI